MSRELFPSVRLYLKKRFSTAPCPPCPPSRRYPDSRCQPWRPTLRIVSSVAFRCAPRALGAVRRHRPSSRWDHDLDVRGADLTEQLVH